MWRLDAIVFDKLEDPTPKTVLPPNKTTFFSGKFFLFLSAVEARLDSLIIISLILPKTRLAKSTP